MFKQKIPAKHLILLTCTVNPKTKKYIVRSDSRIRLADYIESISYIVNQTMNEQIDILVVENSNSIEQLMEGIKRNHIAIEKIRFLQASIDEKSADSGISAGEHQMLREVATLENLEVYEVIWKLTGRLRVQNLVKIIRKSQGEMRANRFHSTEYSTDSRFFGMSPRVFKYFASRRVEYSENRNPWPENLDRGYNSLEFYLSHFSLDLQSGGIVVKGLPQIPIYLGTSASTGKKLDSFDTVCKTKIANFMRKLSIKSLLGISP